MRRRLLVVGAVTVFGLILAALLTWYGIGRKSLKGGSRSHLTPEYLVKRELLKAAYYDVRRRGALSPSALEKVRRLVNDPNKYIRVRALTVLRAAKLSDPQQRQFAIQTAITRLGDPAWIVRIYALRVLADQGAQEAVSHILPLLNDPQPEVREEAKKTLQKLGYKVK